MTDKWVVRFDRDDTVAAGPFDTEDEAERYVDGWDDVYACRED